jgi:hypothetical protein
MSRRRNPALATLAPDEVTRFLSILERTQQQLQACLPALEMGQVSEKEAATMTVMRLGSVLATDVAALAAMVRQVHVAEGGTGDESAGGSGPGQAHRA